MYVEIMKINISCMVIKSAMKLSVCLRVTVLMISICVIIANHIQIMLLCFHSFSSGKMINMIYGNYLLYTEEDQFNRHGKVYDTYSFLITYVLNKFSVDEVIERGII